MTSIHPRLLLMPCVTLWLGLAPPLTNKPVSSRLTGSLWVGSALGQTCPEPWASAPNAYGVVILSRATAPARRARSRNSA
jgi:hypothetical protein